MFLPLLELPIDAGTERKLLKSECIHTIDVLDNSLLAFAVCVTVAEDLRVFLQEFIFSHRELIGELSNIPNWEMWRCVESTSDCIKITFADPLVPECLVNINNNDDYFRFRLRRDRSDEPPNSSFFQHDTFEMTVDAENKWSVTLTLADIKCMLCRFKLVVNGKGYWCNEPSNNTTFPIVAYAMRASTESTVPGAVEWHQDRQGRGALLNCIRSMGDSGASTEVLCPVPERSLPYDDFSNAVCIRCDPFPRNRTVVFNGAWYHRAPTNGGSREFLQVDLHHEASNIALVHAFINTCTTAASVRR